MVGAPLTGIGQTRAASGCKTDKLRLTWGFWGQILISKERGELEKHLAKDGIQVEWIGPFPNHAPALQAVTGGTADLGFGGSTTPALAAIIAGSLLVFSQFLIAYDLVWHAQRRNASSFLSLHAADAWPHPSGVWILVGANAYVVEITI